jgi:hypothetical protein
LRARNCRARKIAAFRHQNILDDFPGTNDALRMSHCDNRGLANHRDHPVSESMSSVAGFNFTDREWPHGWKGSGLPHGAVFSR